MFRWAAVLAAVAAIVPATAANPPAAPADAAEMQRLWDDLGGQDRAKIRQAVTRLRRGGDAAAGFLGARVAEMIADARPEALTRLLAELDARQSAVRERATRRLAAIAPAVAEELRQARRRARSAEVRVRLAGILSGQGGPPPDEDGMNSVVGQRLRAGAAGGFGGPLHLVRAGAVLRAINSAAAKDTLGRIDKSPVRPYLRYIEAAGHVLEAGFVPDKAVYVAGEPVQQITFLVRNLADEPLIFETGGDYRGRARPERFIVEAFDAAGRLADDPRGGRGVMGGILGRAKLEPGQVYVERLVVDHWRRLDGPGRYTFRCLRVLGGGRDDPYRPAVRRRAPRLPDDPAKLKLTGGIGVLTTFTITIENRDEAKLRTVIAGCGRDLRETDERAQRRAWWTLRQMHHEAAVPHLLWGLRQSDRAMQVQALRALSRYGTPAAASAAIRSLRASHADVQTAAAAALRQAPGEVDPPAVLKALLAAMKDPGAGVRAAAADALAGPAAKAGRRPAVEALTAALDDGEPSVRVRAAESLAGLNVRPAVAKIRRHLADDRIRMSDCLLALGEAFDPAWITPLVRPAKGNAWQGAVWYIRRKGGGKGGRALARCLQFDKPSARNYFNYTLVWQIGVCGGPKLKYHHSFDDEGTAEQLAENRRTLAALRAWAGRLPPTPPAKSAP